jgi:hypothetical protein
VHVHVGRQWVFVRVASTALVGIRALDTRGSLRSRPGHS